MREFNLTSIRLHKILKFGFPFEVLNRDLKLIFASNLIGSFGDGLYAYLLPNYMAETLKASSVEIGMLYAIMGLVAALTLLVAGTLADKYDRKKIMIAGWIAWVPAPIIFSHCRKLASNAAWNGFMGCLAWWTDRHSLHRHSRT